jgi:hypothetical protein
MANPQQNEQSSQPPCVVLAVRQNVERQSKQEPCLLLAPEFLETTISSPIGLVQPASKGLAHAHEPIAHSIARHNSLHPQCDYLRRDRSQGAADVISKFAGRMRSDQKMLDNEARRGNAKKGRMDKCFHVTQAAAHRIPNETSTNNQPFQTRRVCCG